mmetsp:Transcript_30578/g.60496  ORF Transcript_30578/g.60496 Transcript_30578/m.60496 type:complete len:103 (+) Transcript_30578:229-537(+)
MVTLRDMWGAPKDGGAAAGKPRGRDASKQPQGKQKSAEGPPVEEVRRIALRAGTILLAEPHPEANSFLVCSVECGDGLAEDGLPPQGPTRHTGRVPHQPEAS